MADGTLISALIGSMDVGDVSSFTAMFMYQGFNPEMVFAHLAKVKNDGGISDEEFKTDMKTLVVVGVVMGNYNDRNSSKISDEGKDKGDKLIAKYKMIKGGVRQDRKAVNVPRILASFPVLTIKVVMKAPPRNYGGVFGADELPQFMKTPVFPSIVPKDFPEAVKKFILTASTCYTAEQTMAISQDEKVKNDAVSAFNDQWRYTEISHSSSVPTQVERTATLRVMPFSYSALKLVLENYTRITGKPVSLPGMDVMTSAGLTISN